MVSSRSRLAATIDVGVLVACCASAPSTAAESSGVPRVVVKTSP